DRHDLQPPSDLAQPLQRERHRFALEGDQLVQDEEESRGHAPARELLRHRDEDQHQGEEAREEIEGDRVGDHHRVAGEKLPRHPPEPRYDSRAPRPREARAHGGAAPRVRPARRQEKYAGRPSASRPSPHSDSIGRSTSVFTTNAIAVRMNTTGTTGYPHTR